MLKKVCCVLILLTLVFSQAACGGGTGSGSASNDSGQSLASDGDVRTETSDSTEYKPIELKFASHSTSTQPNSVYLQEIFDKIAEDTEGRVTITAYFGAVLGSATDGLNMLDTGVCDILWTSTGFFADMFPVSEIFFLPMVCSRGDSATNAWWDMYAETPEYWAEELDGYYPWMMYAIAHGTLGTKFYVESLDDLKGQSIRAAAGPVTDMVNAWGASPIMIPSSDMYTALEKGTISGYVFDVGGVNSFRWYEVTDYYLDCSFMNTTALVLINEDKWNQISPEDQAIINKYGLRDGSLEILDVHLKEQEAIIEELGDAYRYDTDSAFYQELKRIAEDVSDVWIERHTSSTIPMNELVVRAVERINQYES